MEDIKSEYSFLESAYAGDIRELETKLSAQLKDLCERNLQLSRNNAELLRSAEIGWNAEAQIKKFHMIESDLTGEIKALRYEREHLAAQLQERERSVAAQGAEIRALQAKAGKIEQDHRARAENFERQISAAHAVSARLESELAEQNRRHEQALHEMRRVHEGLLAKTRAESGAESSEMAQSARRAETEIRELRKALAEARGVAADFDAQAAELNRQIAVSRAEESRLQQAMAALSRKHEQMMGAAQESFHAQLSELGKVAWSAGIEIQNLKEALQASRTEIANLNERLAAQDENYRVQLADLARSGWESEQELQKLQKIHSEMEEESSRQRAAYEKTVAELKRLLENERATHAQTKHREAAIRLEAERATEQAKTFALAAQAAEESKHRAVGEAVRAKNEELAKVIEEKIQAESRFESQKSAVSGMSSELDLKIRELRESRDTVQKQMNVIGDLSRVSQEKTAEAAALRAKIERAEEQIRAKDDSLAALLRDSAAKEELIQRQIKTLANMTKNDKEKDLEVQRFRLIESSLNESVAELRRAGMERDQLRKEFEAHISRLNSQLNETQSSSNHEILSLNTQLQSVRAQLEAARETVGILKAERDEARERLETERDNARQMAEIQDHRAETERAELERLNAALQQREYQLRQYAASVSDEKSEVLRRAKHLAEEIRAAATLAPLKDYLALTEFELSKVEMQLRKTPVISIERPRLEASFNQMIEQRDFLKGAIANSQAQLDRQAAQLLKIAKPEKLSPIPPLPPRKTGV